MDTSLAKKRPREGSAAANDTVQGEVLYTPPPPADSNKRLKQVWAAWPQRGSSVPHSSHSPICRPSVPRKHLEGR